MRTHLVRRAHRQGALLSIPSSALRDAISAASCAYGISSQSIHSKLADYFLQQSAWDLRSGRPKPNHRRVAEAAYHLIKAQRHGELFDLLTDPAFLESCAFDAPDEDPASAMESRSVRLQRLIVDLQTAVQKLSEQPQAASEPAMVRRQLSHS